MVARKKSKSHIRATATIELAAGDAVWCYLRHSPGEDQTILSQRVDVEKFAREQRIDVAHWYIDEARSGGSVRRIVSD
jgi:hypothetical protein